MNIAILSDIHGNHIALEECMKYLQDRDIDAYCFLGDYTGEFPGIEQTMAILYELQRTKQCYFLRGNKEDYQLFGLGEGHPEWDAYKSTLGMLRYATKHLTKKDLEFFESLPITMTVKTKGLPDLVICHGSPRKVNEKFGMNEQALKEVVEATEANYIICGHTHRKMELKYDSTTIWNPGSVGCSIDIPYQYQFMILHDRNGEWEPEFIALEADIDRLINEMKQAGLYEIAPNWSRLTELMLTGKLKSDTHGGVLNRAMRICTEKYGECNWPAVPEDCFEDAFKEMGIE